MGLTGQAKGENREARAGHSGNERIQEVDKDAATLSVSLPPLGYPVQTQAGPGDGEGAGGGGGGRCQTRATRRGTAAHVGSHTAPPPPGGRAPAVTGASPHRGGRGTLTTARTGRGGTVRGGQTARRRPARTGGSDEFHAEKHAPPSALRQWAAGGHLHSPPPHRPRGIGTRPPRNVELAIGSRGAYGGRGPEGPAGGGLPRGGVALE